MTLELYKVLHITGLALLMLGLGALLVGPPQENRRMGMMLHGIGLIVMLVAGFGAMAKKGIMGPDEWPGYLIAKMGLFVVLGVLPLLVRKDLVPRGFGWIVAALLVFGAAWLALVQP